MPDRFGFPEIDIQLRFCEKSVIPAQGAVIRGSGDEIIAVFLPVRIDVPAVKSIAEPSRPVFEGQPFLLKVADVEEICREVETREMNRYGILAKSR